MVTVPGKPQFERREPKDIKIDFDFVSGLEGGQKLEGYVPSDNSGVTAATALDLKDKSFEKLIGLGISPETAQVLSPFTGLSGDAARKRAKELVLTQEQADEIDSAVKSSFAKDIAKQFKNITGHNFYELPPAAQTVVFSVGYQYGSLSRTPKFMKAFADGDLMAAVNELNDFQDKYPTRRKQEAAYLQEALLLQEEGSIITASALDPNAFKKDPKQVAEDRKIVKDTGIPAEVVDRNRQDIRDFIKKNKSEEVLARSPTTARFLSVTEHLSVANQDIEKLSAVETIVRFGRAALGGPVDVIGRSLEGLGETYGIAGRNISEATKKGLRAIGADALADALGQPVPWYLAPSEIIKRPGQGIRKIEEAITPSDPNFIEKVAGGVTQMAAQWAVGIATGGIGLSASLFGQGVSQAKDQTEANKEQDIKVPEWKGDLASILGGTVTAVTEKYGLNLIFDKIPAAARNRMLAILMGAGTEATQEVLEGIGHNLVQMFLINPNQPIFEGWKEDATVAGTVGAIVEGAIFRKRRQPAQVAGAMQAAREELEDSVIKDVALDIAADHMAEVVADVGVDEVRLSARRTLEWAEKEPEGVLNTLDRLGVADQMQEALAAGDEIVIDGKTFAREVLMSDHYESVGDHIRFRANMATLDETIEEIKASAKDVTTLIDEGTSGIEETLAQRTKKFVKQFVSDKETVDLADILRRAPDDVLGALDTLITQVNERKGVADEIITEGRLTAIDKELSKLDIEITKLSEEIEQRAAEGKSNKQREARLQRLIAQQEQLIEEQSELGLPSQKAGLLEEFDDGPHKAKKPRSNAITKVEKLQKLNVNVTKQSVRDVRKAFKDGMRTAKKDIKEAQTILQTLIQKSGLEQKDRSKFLATLKTIQSSEQLARKLPAIQNRVIKLLEAEQKRQLKAGLKKTLKAFKTKKQGNKPVGRLTPELSAFVDNLEKFIRLKKEDAAEVLASRLNQEDMIANAPSPAQAFENSILQLISDPDSVSASRLEDLLVALNDSITTGKTINQIGNAFRFAEAEDIRREFLELTMPEPDVPISRVRRGIQGAAGTVWLGWNGAWWNKLQHVLVSSDKKRVDKLIERLSLFDESRVHERNKQNTVEKFRRMAQEATGLTERQLLKRWQKDMTEEVEVGTFTHAIQRTPILEGKKVVGHKIKKGKEKTIRMTRAQLRKRVMEMRNPQLRELAKHPETEGYTEEIIEAMESTLDETDHQLIETQLEFYADYYDRVNEAYEKIYGVSLPFVEQYTPVRRDFTGDAQDEFLKSVLYRGGVVPGSLKSRKPTLNRLKAIGDVETLQSHIVEMEYFIAFADKVRLLNVVFAGENNKLMNRISDNFGKHVTRTIQNDLAYFANKGVQSAMVGEHIFVRLMRNFGFAQLGAKPQIGLKQLASFGALAEDVKSHHFIEGLGAFIANPRRAFRVLNQSDYFQLRGIQIDNDFKDLTADALSGKLTNFMGRNPSFTRIMMLPIRYGDKGAIALGGYAHIHARMREGATQEEAIRSFEKISARTQQSADPDQISELQRTNALGRVLAQFMSSANAITRGEISAIGEFSKGRINKREFAKRIFVYHFLIPNLIMFLTNGFNWDEEDQLQASILGSFNGLFIIGDALEVVANWTLGAENPFLVEGRHPLQLFNNLFKAIAADDIDDISWESFVEGNRAIDRMARAAGEFTGIPIATLLNEMRGLVKVTEGDVEEGTALMLGYSPYIIEKNEIGE